MDENQFPWDTEITARELMHVSKSVTFQGMAGYRIKRLARDRNVSEGTIIKEMALEGLKGLGLVSPSYDLSAMRRGL